MSLKDLRSWATERSQGDGEYARAMRETVKQIDKIAQTAGRLFRRDTCPHATTTYYTKMKIVKCDDCGTVLDTRGV